TPIPRLKQSDRRAIAMLSCDSSAEIDATAVFDRLPEKEMMLLRNRFDHWIGGGIFDKYHHGWPNRPDYKECYVFQWKGRNENHRLYGFLINPMPQGNPQFRLCVLVSHGVKTKWETDPNELNGANALRSQAAVIAAIQKTFPDRKKGERKQWLQ